MNTSCEELLLTSLTNYYNENQEYKKVLKCIIEGKHKLSLRLIDWLVTHYSKSHNVLFWVYKNSNEVYDSYPVHLSDSKNVRKVSLYLDYRSQLKSFAKINFDSFRRHNRITFFIDMEANDFIETTIGQLNFFRWAFNNNILEYAVRNYDKIYQHMVDNNSYNKPKKEKQQHNNVQDITKALCTLRFD